MKRWVAPSGVIVISVVDEPVYRIWDTNPVLFYLWSEWLWTKRVFRGMKLIVQDSLTRANLVRKEVPDAEED